MRVWDAELIAKKKELYPVTDGLVFWIDGQDELYGDHVISGESPTLYDKAHMFDRINNVRVNFNGSLGLIAETPIIKGVYKTGTSTGTSVVRSASDVSGILTVEYVYNSPNAFWQFGFEPNSGYITFPKTTAGGSRASLVSGTPCMHLLGKKSEITGYPLIYVNGVDSTSYIGTASVMSALSGTVKCDFRWQGRIGCIRLYNRILSDAEILQNLEYEKSIGRLVL